MNSLVAPALLVCAAAVAGGQQTEGRPAGLPVSITGVVVTAGDTSRPVRRALVQLTPDQIEASSQWWTRTVGDFPSTFTDADGRFAFRGLPAGRYRLTASKPAFLTTEFGASRPGGPGAAIAVSATQSIEDLRVTLEPGGVISGVVYGSDGRPAAHIAVRAIRRGGGGSGGSGFVLTDDRGAYRLFGLLPGDYTVIASPITSTAPMTAVSVAEVDALLAALDRTFGALRMPESGPAAPRASALRPFQVAPVFFPGTTDQAAAAVVQVDAGATRDGVDFALVPAGTAFVAGRVVTPDGSPAAGVPVSVSSAGAATTGTDGTFRVNNVAPGRHRVSARVTPLTTALAAGRPLNADVLTEASSRGVVSWAATDLDVASAGVADLVLVLRPGLTLSGRVRFDGTSRPASADLSSLGLVVETDSGGRVAVAVQPDGAFTAIGLLPGVVQITVRAAPPGWWLRSAMAAGLDLLDVPLALDDVSGDLTDVVLTFSDRHTELSGTLITDAGEPPSSYVVVVVPSERDWWHSRSRRLAFTRPGTDGRFVFHNLPPGSYVLAAVTDLDPVTYRETAFLEQVAAAGIPVTVEEGGITRQDVRIVR